MTCYYNITMITVCLCWMASPSGARTGVLSVGVWFSSFPWQLPGSGPFFVYHHPIQDPAVNLWLLDPLLAGLKPTTAPLALAEVCVICLTGPAIHCHDNSSQQALPWTQPSILGLSAATNPKSQTCFCSGQATCILIYQSVSSDITGSCQ